MSRPSRAISSAMLTLFILASETASRLSLPLFLEAPEAERQELGLGDLVDHPRELVLHELEGGERPPELRAVLRVRQRLVEDGHRRPTAPHAMP